MSPYERYRPLMKTGDIIAFSGKGRISNLIKFATRSPYSHIGLVVNTMMEPGWGQSLLIIESTTLNILPDVYSGKKVKGVQMQFLSQRLAHYDGQAWWASLKKSIPSKNLVPMLNWLRNIHKHHTPYDTLQAIGSALDQIDRIGFANDRDDQSLFCSELVTHALQLAGVVPEEVNPSECTPEDVMQFACVGKAVRVK